MDAADPASNWFAAQTTWRCFYSVPSKTILNRFIGSQMKRKLLVEFTNDTNARSDHAEN
jgi:hypothetical protein